MKYGKETGEDIMDKIDSIEDHLSDLRANSASAIPTILKILFDDTTVEETSNWNKMVKKFLNYRITIQPTTLRKLMSHLLPKLLVKKKWLKKLLKETKNQQFKIKTKKTK